MLIRQMYIKDFIQGHIKQTKVRIIRADTYENCPASSAVTRARAGHTQPPPSHPRASSPREGCSKHASSGYATAPTAARDLLPVLGTRQCTLQVL